MPAQKLKEFLDSQQVKYVTIRHSAAFTAQEIASLAHIRGELAKTVIVNVDGKMAMAVLPASHKVDTALLKTVAGAAVVGLASELEFKSLFPLRTGRHAAVRQSVWPTGFCRGKPGQG